MAPRRLERRARVLLHQAGHRAPADDLRTQAAERYPSLSEAEREEIVALAIEIEHTEGGRRIAPSTPTPAEEDTMPKAKTYPPGIRELVLDALRRDPTTVAQDVLDHVLRQYPGLDLTKSHFYSKFWGPVRKELGITGSGAAAGRNATPEPPVEKKPAPAKVEKPAPAANGNGSHPVAVEPAPVNRIAALSSEVASLRQTYEAGPGVHLEELDGEWRLRADLFFPALAPAAAVLAVLAHAVAAHQKGEEGES